MSRKRKANIGDDDLEGYDSSFEDDELDSKGITKKKSKHTDLTGKESTLTVATGSKGLPSKEYFQNELTRAESYKNRYFALNAYERHRKLINDYFLYHPGAEEKLLKRDSSKDKRDIDIIRANHRFLWNEDDCADTWEKQLAKKYYDKLFKEYCICDLSRYKENKVAMRWRTEHELVEGEGQFSCGARKCSNSERLRTWEVNFAYMEDSVKKNALVKLRLCPECSDKLNYHHKRKEVKAKKHSSKERRHSHGRSSSSKSKSGRRSPKPCSSTSRSISESLPESDSQQEEAPSKSPENIWKEPLAVPEMKSREEEFDEYLDDLFV